MVHFFQERRWRVGCGLEWGECRCKLPALIQWKFTRLVNFSRSMIYDAVENTLLIRPKLNTSPTFCLTVFIETTCFSCIRRRTWLGDLYFHSCPWQLAQLPHDWKNRSPSWDWSVQEFLSSSRNLRLHQDCLYFGGCITIWRASWGCPLRGLGGLCIANLAEHWLQSPTEL